MMDLDMLMTEADPARNVPLGGPESPEAARLYRQIITGHEPAPAQARPRRWRVVVPAGAMAAAAMAAVIAVTLPVGPPAAPSATTLAVLVRAALTAARQPSGPGPGPGRYVYVKDIEGVRVEAGRRGAAPTRSSICPELVQTWAALNGAGRQLTEPYAPKECRGWHESHTFPPGTRVDGGPIGGVYPDAASLPTKPAALERAIEHLFPQVRWPNSAAMLQFAGTFLQAAAPPAVRAALYRMIGRLPGIKDLGPMTDMLGRHGIGVGINQFGGVRDVLIFNPATSAVLEEEDVVIHPHDGLRAGTVTGYNVYLTPGVVDSLTATPQAG